MKSLGFIPHLLALVLMVTYLYFIGVCFAWVYMAPIDFWGWWAMFLKSLGVTVAMTFICAVVGLVERIRRDIFAPYRYAHSTYTRSTDGNRQMIDIESNALALAQKASEAARKNNNTNQDAAMFLIAQYEAHKHEFTGDEQAVMKAITNRAVRILQEAR